MRSLWIKCSSLARALFLASLVIMLTTVPAWAHKVNVYAYAEGETVHVRGYFSKNPAKNCVVIVTAPDGTRLVTGKTDEKGEFVFKAPIRADLIIKIVAGEGHTNSYVIKAEDLPGDLPQLGEKKTATPDMQEDSIRKEPQNESAEKPEIRFSLQEIEGIVEKVAERKLAPIRKMLLEQQEKSKSASFEKVLAGLGIIFGLMGLTMFLRSIWHNKKQ